MLVLDGVLPEINGGWMRPQQCAGVVDTVALGRLRVGRFYVAANVIFRWPSQRHSPACPNLERACLRTPARGVRSPSATKVVNKCY